MKKLLSLLIIVMFNFLGALPGRAQTKTCSPQSTLQPVITIKGMDPVGTEVKGVVTTAQYNTCGQLQGTPFAGTPSPTPAGNCHAYALYVGQGGPYFGKYKFALAIDNAVTTVVDQCTIKSAHNSISEFHKLLNANFYESTGNSKKGDIIVIWGNSDKTTPFHSAMYNGDGTYSQVAGIGAPVEPRVSLSTIKTQYMNGSRYLQYYSRKNTNTYPSNSAAGVLPDLCSNIKKCLNSSSLTISGPGIACQGNGNYTTKLTGAPADATVTWNGVPSVNFSPSSGTATKNSDGTYSATYTVLNGGSTGKIEFTIGGTCYHPETVSSSTIQIGAYNIINLPTSGPAIACPGKGSYTTKLSGAPTNATITWEGVPAANFSPSSGTATKNSDGTYSATYTVLNGGTTGQIRFKIGGTCDQVLSSTMQIGAYTTSSFPISGPSSITAGQSVTVTAPYLQHAQTNGYLWEAYTNYQGSMKLLYKVEGGRSWTFTAPAAGFNGLQFLLRVRNTCNSTTDPAPTPPSTLYILENRSSTYRYSNTEATNTSPVTIFPVPANNELNIEINSAFQSAKITRIQLFNVIGENVLSEEAETSLIKLPTVHLKNGMYFLKLTNGINSYSKKIYISR